MKSNSQSIKYWKMKLTGKKSIRKGKKKLIEPG
jgi:hypothetical protein